MGVETTPPELLPLVNVPSPLDAPSKRVNLEGVGVKGKVGVALRNVWAFILVPGWTGTSFLLA